MDNPHAFWSAVDAALLAHGPGVLLCVVESIGSSPGRAGFKAFAAGEHLLLGSIGGGSMEQKLVTLARSLLAEPQRFPFVKRQVHREGLGHDRSGMICSGEQTVAFIRLGEHHRPILAALCDALHTNAGAVIQLGPDGLTLLPQGDGTGFEMDAGGDWRYRERLGVMPRVAIVGGGHVGLALSRTLYQLGFRVHLFDDRPDLNTIAANRYLHACTITDYARIAEVMPDDPALFVVLVSFGFRTDEQVLRQLLLRPCRYIGMMGSSAKVQALFAALRRDGYPEEALARVHAPIGIPINSRTPEEIAISIAAQLIRMKNDPDPR